MFAKILGQLFGSGDGNSQPAASGNNHQPATGTFEPIAGVSLEKYAELCAKMANTPNDDEAFADVAEQNGVSRDNWKSARTGWNARMEDPSNAGKVAIAYMPLYQDALAKYGGEVASATFEEYIEMSAMINSDLKGPNARPKDLDAMYARFNINPQKWSQISTHWVGKLTTDPLLGADYAEKCRARVKEMDDEFLRNNKA